MPVVGRSDLSWLLCCAVRYSLGRSSYAPAYTAEMVGAYLDALNRMERRALAGDIRNYLDRDHDDSQRSPDIRATWEALAARLEEETPECPKPKM